MTEKEMRSVVGEFIKKSMRTVVFPSAVGVGLVLAAGCGDDTDGVKYAAPKYDMKIPNDQNMNTLYSAPMKDMKAIGDVAPLYGAPLDQKVVSDHYLIYTEYAAPFPEVI